ncbi:MAG: hypothetical protein ACXWN1_00470 [Thermoanaerobaculia bacterium]
MYREQAIIADTLAHYGPFLRQVSSLQLWFVLDAREAGPDTTRDVLLRALTEQGYGSSDRITVLASDAVRGSKAAKVNLAIERLRATQPDLPMLVVFDCDARVEFSEVRIALACASVSAADVVSLVPVPEPGDGSVVVRSAMAHHAERAVSFELGSGCLPRYMRYPTGALMILRPSLLRRIPHLPEPIDDLPLSYLIARLRGDVVTLPAFVRVLPPPDAYNLFRQHIPIFTGVFSVFATLRKFHVTPRLSDYARCTVLYAFYAAEFVSIAAAFVWLAGGTYWPLLLVIAQLAFALFVVERLSAAALLLGTLGYLVRLCLFLWFVLNRAFVRPDLSRIKTAR